MIRPNTGIRRVAAILAASLFAVLSVGTVAAHEEREVADYTIEVGFIDEPVFVGQNSGLEFFVHKGDSRCRGPRVDPQAEVIYRDQKRDLPLEARRGRARRLRLASSIPTAPGPYTFHLFGTIETPGDRRVVHVEPRWVRRGPGTLAGPFPVQFPAQADIVANAQAGKDAASQVTIAVALGAAGLVAGSSASDLHSPVAVGPPEIRMRRRPVALHCGLDLRARRPDARRAGDAGCPSPTPSS